MNDSYKTTVTEPKETASSFIKSMIIDIDDQQKSKCRNTWLYQLNERVIR